MTIELSALKDLLEGMAEESLKEEEIAEIIERSGGPSAVHKRNGTYHELKVLRKISDATGAETQIPKSWLERLFNSIS